MEMKRVLIVLMFFLSMGMVSAQTGPVLDIRMDEGDGATVFDASGNGNDGTHYGNTRLLMHFDGDANDSSSYGNDGMVNGAAWVNGKSGKGLEFDGVDDYVDIPVNVFNQDAGTWSMWVKGNFSGQGPGNIRLFNSDHTSAGNYEFRTWDNLKWIIGNGTTTASVNIGSLVDNEYNHIVFTWEYRPTTNDTLVKGYKAGNYIAEISIDGKISVPDSSIWLGVWGGGYFNGTIDEVTIYSKALSPLEISDLYNAKKAKFTDWTDGKVGNALEFDGVDDYVDPGSMTLSEISVSMWLRWNGAGNNFQHPIKLYQNGNNSIHFYINKKGVNEVRAQYKYNRTKSPALVGPVIVPSEWYHVVYVNDGVSNELYVNGELVDNDSVSAFGSINYSFVIGQSYSASTTFNGTIDEVRIWNRALTEDEIYWQYHWSEYYPRPVIVPVTATGVTGTVLWTGLDQNSGVELSIVSPSGAEYTRDSEGAEARARFIDEVTVTLPVIDYTVTLYNGYKKLKVPATESGKWEFRVRSRNVTDMSVVGEWT